MKISRSVSVLLACALFACSGGNDPIQEEEDPVDEPMEEPEPDEPDAECAAGDDPIVRVGEGVGSAFEELQDGDRLPLVFASQAGMEAAVVLVTEEVGVLEVEEISVELFVDDAPIGESSTDGRSLRCDENLGRVETSLPINVVGHPTVTYVTELADREASLVVSLHGSEGVLASSVVEVILDP